MTLEFFRARRPHAGMTCDVYVNLMEEEAAGVDEARLSGEELTRARSLKLNVQRTRRLGQTFSVAEPLRMALATISAPQLWLVLTEPWCGDSAQTLPVIAKIAAASPAIDLRILRRDENLDIMNLYLTDGVRGIPKLIAFTKEGGELFRWGPRPEPATELFRRLRQAGESKERILEQLHLWYGRDHGGTVAAEFLALLAASA